MCSSDLEHGKEIKLMALILIIDDEPQIRSMLKLMLERDEIGRASCRERV